jgi:hypothetical protein
MGNENKHGIIVFQGSIIPLMPLDVALVGLQASHNYYPTLTTFVDPLLTLPTICTNLGMHSQHCLPYVVSQTHSWLLPTVCNIPIWYVDFDFQVFPFFLLPYTKN